MSSEVSATKKITKAVAKKPLSGKTKAGTKSPAKVNPKGAITPKAPPVGKLTKPAIRRILRNSGVLRIGSGLYESVTTLIQTMVEEYITAALIHTEYSRRRTIYRVDLKAALESKGKFLAADLNDNAKHTASLQPCKAGTKRSKPKVQKEGETKRPHRFRPGTVSAREIRHLQKNSTGLEIPRNNFSNLTRGIAKKHPLLNDQGEEVIPRFEAGVFDLLHLAIETEIVSLAHCANKLAIHAKRQTVFAKDLQLAMDIRTLE